MLRRDTDGELVLSKPQVSERFLGACEAALGFPLNEFEDWG